MIYINRSDQRHEELFRNQTEVAKDDDVVYYQLVKDGSICWNSVYSMIKRPLKLRNTIDLYLMYWTKPLDAIAYDLS